MTSSKVKRLVSADAALRTLEAALEEEWSDENADTAPTVSLPPELSDAAVCLEWGRSVLAAGIRYPDVRLDAAQADDENYRMVARNGTAIPQHIQDRMHVARLAAEHQSRLDSNVED